ncbi:coiled-coil domain containing protein 64 [Cichlidogyrus casuarinus]|uniref:Coiled-coil domain containing protein 64 n=1 Tax=Cichlidogyrus casuarinus TaxID=1844966 RepID=A0ABD2Q960_9PLAT
MNDEEFLTYVNSLDRMVTSTYDFTQLATLRESQPSTSTQQAETSPHTIEGFRSEVLDIYRQLQQMCIEVSHRIGPVSRDGRATPDELAMVEMNWRIGALRDVLQDLRGLLTELVPPASQQTGSQLQELQNCYLAEHASAEASLRELCQINSQLTQLSRELMHLSNEGAGLANGYVETALPNGIDDSEAIQSRRSQLIARLVSCNL